MKITRVQLKLLQKKKQLRNFHVDRYAYTKIRLDGKKFIYGILADDRFTYGLPQNTPRKSFNAIYGNIKAINKAVSDSKSIFIVEGEKDVNTFSHEFITEYHSNDNWGESI